MPSFLISLHPKHQRTFSVVSLTELLPKHIYMRPFISPLICVPATFTSSCCGFIRRTDSPGWNLPGCSWLTSISGTQSYSPLTLKKKSGKRLFYCLYFQLKFFFLLPRKPGDPPRTRHRCLQISAAAALIGTRQGEIRASAAAQATSESIMGFFPPLLLLLLWVVAHRHCAIRSPVKT